MLLLCDKKGQVRKCFVTHLQAGQIVSNMEKKSQEKKVSKDKKKSKVLNPKNGKMNQGTQGLLATAGGIAGGLAADLAVEVTGNIVSDCLSDALFGN